MEHKISANLFDSIFSFSPKNALLSVRLLDERFMESTFGGYILLVRYATAFVWLPLLSFINGCKISSPS